MELSNQESDFFRFLQPIICLNVRDTVIPGRLKVERLVLKTLIQSKRVEANALHSIACKRAPTSGQIYLCEAL